MSYYETQAEKSDHFFFEKRTVDALEAHFHSRVEIIIAERGELPVTVNGEKHVLRGGEAFFCDGFSVHSYGKATSDFTAYAILCDKSFFAEPAARLEGKTFPVFFGFKNFPLLETLYENYLASEDKALTLFGACSLLAAEFLKTAKPVACRTERGETLVCGILEYIDGHLEEKISLPVLAEEFGYSKEYISRTFSKYVGAMPRYINRLRVQKARRMLAEGGRTVIETAFLCGFESPNTFYRAYKDAFGTPPKTACPDR